MSNEFSSNKKVEVKIQRILSELISIKVSDARLRNIIISDVRVTKDISTAKVYFLILNKQYESQQIELILKKATGFLKKEMSTQLSLKKLPNLIFIYDTKEQEALYMNNLIDKTIINDQKIK